MKLNYWLIIILLSCFTINAFGQKPDEVNNNGYNRFYFSNGNISSEGNLVDGKPDGIWKSYYDQGKLKSEGNRVNGLLDGVWKFFNEDGSLSAEYMYLKGNKSGSQKEYFANGKVRSDVPVVAGLREGMALYYNDKGFLIKEIPFHEGVENGVGKSFGEDERIIAITSYKNGYVIKEEKINRLDKFNFKQGVWKEFYEDIKIKTEAIYKDDKLEGPFKYYGTDGSVKKVEIYRNGELVIDKRAEVKLEIDRDYHNNGRVKSSVNIIDGQKQGVYREYDRQGNITASKLFRSNEVVGEGLVDESMLYQGPWKFYYPNGIIKSEGTYKDGKRDGEWKFYYENGKLQQTGNYSKDKPDGAWKWYFITEKLLREEFYVKGNEDGYMKEFGESGSVVAEGNYIDGRRDGPWKFISDSYTAQGNYIDGLFTGEWKGYFSNGKKAFEGAYFDGSENGEHKYYYDNGKLREVRSYKLGIPDGEWRSYDITGERVLTTTYLAGDIIKIDGSRIKPVRK